MVTPKKTGSSHLKCSAFDKGMIFHSHANKTHFHKKGSVLGLILKVRVFGLGNGLFRRFMILYKVGNHFVHFLSKGWCFHKTTDRNDILKGLAF